MSTTLITPSVTRPTADAVRQRTIWAAAGLSGVVASAATTIAVVAARAADIPVDVDGERIPLLGFPQLTMVGALIGAVLAIVLAKRARQPRRTFTITTIVLTAASIVPDLLIEASTGSKSVLVLTHLVAAGMIVPAIASRLHRWR